MILFLSLAVVSFPASPAAGAESMTNVTYVIPVKGIMESGMLYMLRLGFKRAEDAKASTIIFDMDTPGGSVDVMEEIIRRLISLPENVKTITFVNKDALSAGALMAMATDRIYMAPGSRLGASALVQLTGDIPEGDMKEKAVSSTLALVTSAARKKGHDVDLLRAMVRRDAEYKIGEETICPSGELLTLTDDMAARIVERNGAQTPLLSAGTVKSFEELLAAAGLKGSQVIHLTLSSSERLARYVKLLSALFLIGGLLGIYIEIKTPGFGVPGILGIFSLAIFLWAHFIAGEAGSVEILLLLVGLMLVVTEIFLLPGMGFIGIAGVSLMLVALVMAMVEHYPGGSWFEVPQFDIQNAFWNMSGSVIVSFVLGALLARFLPSMPIYRRIALVNSLDQKDGYVSGSASADLVGLRGTAVTALRPGGIAQFGDRRLDVVTRGDFLESGTQIVIAEARGTRIVVDAVAGNSDVPNASKDTNA